MTDVAAIEEQLSETKDCLEDSSCYVTRGEGDSMCLNHSENASLDNEVDGDVMGLRSATKIGQKRAKEPETMDHSGTRMYVTRIRIPSQAKSTTPTTPPT